jgi:hypothetical protein
MRACSAWTARQGGLLALEPHTCQFEFADEPARGRQVLVGVAELRDRLLDVEAGGAAALEAQARDLDRAVGEVPGRPRQGHLELGLADLRPGAGDLGHGLEPRGVGLGLGVAPRPGAPG